MGNQYTQRAGKGPLHIADALSGTSEGFMCGPVWASLSREEKRHQLYLNQKETLNLFLERGAITPDQFSKSLHDLQEKMGEVE